MGIPSIERLQMTRLPDLFGVTYLINLPERVDRLKSAKRQLSSVNWDIGPDGIRVFPALRYVDLRNDYCALVVSENGKVRWWRESADFKGSFWIDPGTKLSPHTVAAGIFRGESKPARPERVAHPSGP